MKSKLMMLLFIASEAFFFLALIISYVVYAHPGGTLSSTAEYLDVPRTAIFSVLLFASSATIITAESQFKKGKRKSMQFWMLATIVLGLVFLAGQGTEYYHLYNDDVTISKNVFGSAFFTLTGFHGLHVIFGLIVLSVLTFMFFTGKFTRLESSALVSASIYWHFVDGVWVAVFSVVYLSTLL